MSSSSQQPSFWGWIDANQDKLVARLAEAVAIPSVSGDSARRQDCFRMADFLQDQLEALGVKVTRRALGKQSLDGQELDLPPVLFGELGTDPKKRTLLVYGH